MSSTSVDVSRKSIALSKNLNCSAIASTRYKSVLFPPSDLEQIVLSRIFGDGTTTTLPTEATAGSILVSVEGNGPVVSHKKSE